MMNDPNLSPDDKIWVEKFSEMAEIKIRNSGFTFDFNIYSISEGLGFDLSCLNKEGTLMYAVWVTLLSVLKKYCALEHLKYPNLESFLSEYDGWFTNENEKEKVNLWQTANWMSILFKMTTARKNKGLAMQVVPKLVEGWSAKYVTGSGQTRATANRVHIFEVEGNTKACQRGKIRTKRKGDEQTAKRKHPVSEEEKQARKKKRALKASMQAMKNYATNPVDLNIQNIRTSSRRDGNGFATLLEVGSDMNASNAEDQSNDIKRAYLKLIRDQSTASMASVTREGMHPDYELTRYTSSMLDPMNFILTGPSELQRGYSWTEIPVNTGSSSGKGHDTTHDDLAGSHILLSMATSGASPALPQEAGSIVEGQGLADMFSGYK